MGNDTGRAPAQDPQDLERLLVARQHKGDVGGMLALYEPDAVLDCGNGKLVRGLEAIRAYFEGVMSQGRVFEIGDQREALVSGDLALTSTGFRDGSVTSEVARRQPDGTWLWVLDRFAVK